MCRCDGDAPSPAASRVSFPCLAQNQARAAYYSRLVSYMPWRQEVRFPSAFQMFLCLRLLLDAKHGGSAYARWSSSVVGWLGMEMCAARDMCFAATGSSQPKRETSCRSWPGIWRRAVNPGLLARQAPFSSEEVAVGRDRDGSALRRESHARQTLLCRSNAVGTECIG